MPPITFSAFGAVLWFAAGAILAALLLHYTRDLEPFDVDSTAPPPEPVDPWAIQRTLMEASGQELPDSPALTKGVLLYGALTLEEVGETCCALSSLLTTALTGDGDGPVPDDEMNALLRIRAELNIVGNGLQRDAKAIRQELTYVQDLHMPLAEEEAVELFDGTTDVAVVNCGLALSAGLDGSLGYLEVGTSNLSKRNPVTNVIDKTADGKWIKGVNYKPPNLAAVIAWTRVERAPD